MLKVYVIEMYVGDRYEGSYEVVLVTSDAEAAAPYYSSTEHVVTEWEVQNGQSNS